MVLPPTSNGYFIAWQLNTKSVILRMFHKVNTAVHIHNTLLKMSLKHLLLSYIKCIIYVQYILPSTNAEMPLWQHKVHNKQGHNKSNIQQKMALKYTEWKFG